MPLPNQKLIVLVADTASVQTDCNFRYINLIIKIKVLHTNDLHSRFDEVTMRGSKCRDKDRRKNKCVGGVARIKHMVDRIKEQHKPDDNVVFLNAGDFFQVGLKLVQDDSYFLKCRTPRMCGIST